MTGKTLSAVVAFVAGLMRFDTNLLRLTTIAANLEKVAIGEPTKNIDIATITADATDVVITTDSAHGLEVGDNVVITGCTVTAHNGIWAVTVVTSDLVFEFASTADAADDTTGSVAIGNIDVYTCVTSGAVAGESFLVGGDADASATNLAAVINAGDTRGVTATAIASVGVLIESNTAGSRGIVCDTTMAGANNGWAAAATYGGTGSNAAGSIRNSDQVETTPNAVEVALGQAVVKFGFAPASIIVAVRDTNGDTKAWDGAAAVSGNKVTVDNTGDVDFAATDTITISASE